MRFGGRSANDSAHMDEPSFQYIQYRFRHLRHLRPILNDIYWSDVVEKLPAEVPTCLNIAHRVLLASKSRYYVYDTELDYLLDSGSTLEEVYRALLDGKDQKKGGVSEWEKFDADPYSGHYKYFRLWDFGFVRKMVWEVGLFLPPEHRHKPPNPMEWRESLPTLKKREWIL